MPEIAETTSKVILIKDQLDNKMYPITGRFYSGEEALDKTPGSVFFKEDAVYVVVTDGVAKELVFSDAVGDLVNGKITINNKEVGLGEAVIIGAEDIKISEKTLGATITEIEASIVGVFQKLDEETKKLFSELGKKTNQEVFDSKIKEIEDTLKTVTGDTSEQIEEIKKQLRDMLAEETKDIKEALGKEKTETEVATGVFKKIDDAEAKIDTNTADLTTLKSSYIKEINGVSAVENKVTINADKVQYDETQTVKAIIDAVKELSTTTGSELTEKINKVDTEIKALAKRHDEEIETIVGDVIANMTNEETADAYKTLKEITADLLENEGSIKDLLSKIEENKQADIKMSTRVDGMELRVKKAESALESVASDETVGQHSKEIKELKEGKADRTDLESYVQKKVYDAKVKELEESLATKAGLEEEVVKLKEELASKSELSSEVVQLKEELATKAELEAKAKALQEELDATKAKLPKVDLEEGTLTIF